MQRSSFRMVVIIAAAVALVSCASKPRVADAILYDAGNRPVRSAFNAALASRFTVGSSLDALTSFMISLGGACSRNIDGVRYRCWADIDPCINRIQASVEAQGDVITKVEAIEFVLYSCN